MTPNTPIELDMRGKRCPEPIMHLHKAVREALPGSSITVIATDPSTERDVPSFCRNLGHELLSTHCDGEERHFTLRVA